VNLHSEKTTAVEYSGMSTVETSMMEQAELQEEGMDLSAKRQSIRMQCLELLSQGVEHQYITEEEYKTFMANMSEAALEAGGAISEADKTKWMHSWPEWTKHFVEEAKQMSQHFLADVQMAEEQEWISQDSAKRWRERLHTRSSDWQSTKAFLLEFNKSYLKNWKELHTKKQSLMKKVQKLGVTSKQVPELADIEKKDFNDRHYSDRLNTIAIASAALAVFESGTAKNGVLFKKAQAKLEATASSGAMSKQKIGKWLESLFHKNRTPAEIEKILTGTLEQYIGAWTKVRYRFDLAGDQMKKHGIPQGFDLLSPGKFLELDFPQRESYVEEAERAMQTSLKGPSDKPIDQLKLRIRHELQVKDWEGAEELMAEAWTIAEENDRQELRSMETYLKQFRKIDEEERAPGESVQQTLASLRETLSEVPGSVQVLYMEAMQRGYDTLSALTSQMYNLVWCHRNGYLDGHKEEVLYNASFRETEEIVEKGHRQRGLENINLDSVDAENKSDAMRPYNRTWAPTLYHMNSANGSSRARYLEELRGKNAARDYWSTLRLTNISYEKQAYLVSTVHHRLKSGMRKLRDAGVGFSLFGNSSRGSQTHSGGLRLAA